MGRGVNKRVETAQKLSGEFVKPNFKKSKKKKWIYSGIAALIVLGGGGLATARVLKGTTTIPQSDIYQVSTGNVVQTISTSGTIQAPQQISLNFNGVSGLVKTVSVKIGQQVKNGEVLAALDDPSAQAQVTQAEANLLSAQAKLTQTKQGTTSAQIAQDNLNIQKAQQTLAQVQQSYKDQLAVYNDRSAASQAVINAQNTLQKDQAAAANATLVASAQQNLQTAQTILSNDETALSEAETLSVSKTLDQQTIQQTVQQDQNAVTSAQNQVKQDQIALTNAQQQYAQLQSQIQVDAQNLQYQEQQFNDRTSAQQQLDSSKNAITQDQLALQSAQLQLKSDTTPPDQAMLQQAEASVTSAQASLEAAQANLASTELKAPINGVVTQVNLEAGETPGMGSSSSSGSSGSGGGSTAAIVIEDINKLDLQVNLQVSESQIGEIHAGEPAKFTVPAYPGQTFTGTITTVYPTPQVVSNVTEYTVLATIDDTSGKLKAGMTTNAVIQTSEHDNVVTIPAVALQQLGSMEGVYVYGTPSSTSGFGRGSGGGFGGSSGTGGQHNYSGEKSGGGSNGGFNGGNGTLQGGGQRRTGGGASGAPTLSSRLKLPKGVYFQPVQTGLLGVGDVEITRGLTTGEKILLTLPGQSASTTSSSNQGGGFGSRGGFGGGMRVGSGGGGSRG